jgi:hypothetical protein
VNTLGLLKLLVELAMMIARGLAEKKIERRAELEQIEHELAIVKTLVERAHAVRVDVRADLGGRSGGLRDPSRPFGRD